MGFGQVRLGLMHEILGQTPLGPVVFGNNAPDSGNAELLAIGIEETGRQDHREQWLQPLLDGKLRSAFSMTEPETAGSDPTLLQTRAERDGDEYVINGHKWFSSNGSVADFLIVMAVTNPDVHPYQGSSMILVPTGTNGVDIVRDVATMEHPETEFGRFGNHAEIYYRDVRVPVADLIGARARGSRSPSSASVPGGSTTACAGSANRGARSTCCANGRCPAPPTAPSWPRSRRSRTGSPIPWPRCRRPGS